MKHFKLIGLVAAFLPTLVLAQTGISNTKHDMASGSTASTRSVTGLGGTTQTCIFCHTPHNSSAQALIWNKAAFTAVRGWTSGSTTTAGTLLPTDISPASKVCLSCHDGTVGMGDLSNDGDGTSGTITMVGGVDRPSAGYLVGNDTPAMLNNHPISVPYAGSSGYNNGVTTTAPSPITLLAYSQGYVAPATGTCESGTFCTSGSLGVQIRLYGAAIGATGIECGSCHEVHNKYGGTYFLRAPAAGSSICKQCHIK